LSTISDFYILAEIPAPIISIGVKASAIKDIFQQNQNPRAHPHTREKVDSAITATPSALAPFNN